MSGAGPKYVPVTKMRGPLLERGAGIEVTVRNPVEAAGETVLPGAARLSS